MRKRHTKALAQAVAVEGAEGAVGPPVTPPKAPKGAGYGAMEDSASDRGSEASEDDDEAGSSDVDSDTEESLVCPLERIVRDNLASKTLDLRKTEEELGKLQAELHDAESADDGIYGALRAQDRGAAVDTTATQGLGPHGKSAVQLHLSALGLTPDCDAGVRMTGKFDSAESWEDPSRRDDKYLDQFLKQTALQDQIKGLQDKCRALREEVEVAQRAVQEVPALGEDP